MAKRQRKRIPGVQVRRRLDPHNEIFGPDAVRDTTTPGPKVEGSIPADLILYGELGELPPAASSDAKDKEDRDGDE